MAERTLRAVTAGEKKPRDKTVAEAIATGSQREILIATRNRIARTIDDASCPPRDLAALTRRLGDVVKEIAALDAAAAQEAAESAVHPDEAFDASAI